ncbi:MAG: hypothetical protein AVDCRST_MAG60-130, partial [uncultured Nocardioides sp.]
ASGRRVATTRTVPWPGGPRSPSAAPGPTPSAARPAP